MPDSYLVIGGGGLLGHHIVELLLARGEPSVAVFDVVAASFDSRVQVFAGDILDVQRLTEVVKSCAATCIIHTAAILQGPSRQVQFQVNVTGTENVIKVALACGVTKLVYTSSASVVFDGRDQNGIDETLPYPEKFFDTYNETKAIAETAVLKANGQDGLNTASLRVAGLFGPGDRVTIPAFMEVLERGRTGSQIGDNTNLFDWTYIKNAAYAHLLAADRLDPAHPKHALVAGQAFFISNGEPRPWWDFPRAIWKAAGHVPNRTIGTQPFLSRFRVTYVCTARWCNITKARKALDYEPIVSLDDGIQETVKWWKENHRAQSKQS
ncbi:Sterol-4-alpha-carboxylate 3-dehydrogenase, decarboxylating [Grifola frondosa]|uniref:Sterol-4-alpha-carboxylate 3-dehydrogenase, decarboxylating n=1 Tax=Grifola frondosa TaxID=5627 RepID=A0A1C7MME2_GRIFR|nr:Sterol-4-alpha-carboxylate 3-dehydrogenase, decarboxylating [Grifola frondosa]